MSKGALLQGFMRVIHCEFLLNSHCFFEQSEVSDESEGEEGDESEDEEDDDDEDDIDERIEELPKKKSKLPKVHVEDVHSPGEGKEASSFFSSSAGASFSAKSFGELNLSRPLIRACETLGYREPTPIQVI